MYPTHTTYTTFEPTLDVQVREQRERLSGLTRPRRTKQSAAHVRPAKVLSPRRKAALGL